ncbi:MAG: universal stress protein [Desulfonatronovibrio sp.]|nr:universal stress protein [Desulfovibrionales bacterium]
MFKKVLFCADLSPAMDNLLICLGQLKSLGVEEVILAHIVYVANTPGLENSLMRDARPRLEEQKETLEQAGFKVKTELSHGKPAYSLIDVANKYDVDLILVGSHGYGPLTSLALSSSALGGVSEKILNLAKRPVLLSRIKTVEEGKEKNLECGRIFSRVLFPTDFSDTAELALGCLNEVVRKTGCAVDLITVRSSQRDESALKEFKKIDIARLERMKQDLEKQGASAVGVVHKTGKAADEIVDKARDSSLIIMGTQGRNLLNRMILGSVAHDVARKADVPVLFMPAHCLCAVAD